MRFTLEIFVTSLGIKIASIRPIECNKRRNLIHQPIDHYRYISIFNPPKKGFHQRTIEPIASQSQNPLKLSRYN